MKFEINTKKCVVCGHKNTDNTNGKLEGVDIQKNSQKNFPEACCVIVHVKNPQTMS